jgi:hypothetical protein
VLHDNDVVIEQRPLFGDHVDIEVGVRPIGDEQYLRR